jgi:hypothetical protein
MSLARVTIKVASTAIMTVENLLPPRLPMIHEQQLLTLHGDSLSGYGRACVSVFIDHVCGKYIQNSQRHTNVNTLRLTVADLNAIINNETRNVQPEMRMDGSS